MGDQDTATVDCPTCWGSGRLTRKERTVVCSTCDGKKSFTPDEFAREMERMVEAVANLPDAPSNLDPASVALAHFEKADELTPGAGPGVEARFLAEQGIKARPGVERRHKLPHEGGDVSERERELQAMIDTFEETKR